MSRGELIEIFLEETARHLAVAKQIVSAEVPLTVERRHDLQRAMHSVKGMAAALGLAEMQRTAHGAEERLTAPGRTTPARSEKQEHREFLGDVERLEAQLAALRAERNTAPEPALARPELPATRLDAERLDRLLEIALRLATAHQRLEHRLDESDDATMLAVRDELRHAVKELRQEVLELRLVPITGLVPLLDKALRRWAQQRGVQLAFELVGDAVRVDRLILEGLVDPLSQLVRNAAVHGIEPPAERVAAGKDPRGRIVLTVRRDRERLAISVADDGRGIDPAAVIERARQRGVLAPGEVPPGEPLALLTRPDMSGQARPDDLAGRGIGLSAARAGVERLGGEIRLDSAPGAGLRAVIRVPARVALIDALVVEAAGGLYAFPIAGVREVLDPEAPRLRSGASAAAHPLAQLLGAPRELAASERRETCALVLADVDPPLTLLVDRVRGRFEIVCRPLGAPLDRIPPWAGAGLLADGHIALVVDPLRLVRMAQRAHAMSARIGA